MLIMFSWSALRSGTSAGCLMSMTLSRLERSEMQPLRSWPVRPEWRWRYGSRTRSTIWTSMYPAKHLSLPQRSHCSIGKWLKNYIRSFFFTVLFLHSIFYSLTFSFHSSLLLCQDHRAQRWPVSTHLQALPDPHQQDGRGGDPCRGHHSRSHGLLHHSSVWWSWREVWCSFPGGAWCVSCIIIHLPFTAVCLAHKSLRNILTRFSIYSAFPMPEFFE